jgi:hypothetical protein
MAGSCAFPLIDSRLLGAPEHTAKQRYRATKGNQDAAIPDERHKWLPPQTNLPTAIAFLVRLRDYGV